MSTMGSSFLGLSNRVTEEEEEEGKALDLVVWPRGLYVPLELHLFLLGDRICPLVAVLFRADIDIGCTFLVSLDVCLLTGLLWPQ